MWEGNEERGEEGGREVQNSIISTIISDMIHLSPARPLKKGRRQTMHLSIETMKFTMKL